VIDTQKRTMAFANAGMTEPLLFRNDEVQYIKASGMRLPLGVQRKVSYRSKTIQLQSGDLIVFYTDGLPEAMNAQQEQFELAGIETTLRELPPTIPSVQIVKNLLGAVESFCGDAKPHDDLTLVVVRVV
jgi:sigma-B regulation protein RsbU (phosphoserine phosphatase)